MSDPLFPFPFNSSVVSVRHAETSMLYNGLRNVQNIQNQERWSRGSSTLQSQKVQAEGVEHQSDTPSELRRQNLELQRKDYHLETENRDMVHDIRVFTVGMLAGTSCNKQLIDYFQKKVGELYDGYQRVKKAQGDAVYGLFEDLS